MQGIVYSSLAKAVASLAPPLLLLVVVAIDGASGGRAIFDLNHVAHFVDSFAKLRFLFCDTSSFILK